MKTILIFLFCASCTLRNYCFSQTHKEDDVYYDSTTETYISIFPSGKANILIGKGHFRNADFFFRMPYLFGLYHLRNDTLIIKDNDSVVELTFLKKNKCLIPINALELSPKSTFVYKYTNENFDEDFAIRLGGTNNKINYVATPIFEKNKTKMDPDYDGVYVPSNMYATNTDSTGGVFKLILNKGKYEIYFIHKLWLKGRVISVDEEEMVLENKYGKRNFVFKRHDNDIITASVFFKPANGYAFHRIHR